MEKATCLLEGPGDSPAGPSVHVGRLGKVLGSGQLRWR